MKRIEKFLMIDEVDPESIVKKCLLTSEYAIDIDNHSFSWGVKKDEEDSDEEKEKLKKEKKAKKRPKKLKKMTKEEKERETNEQEMVQLNTTEETNQSVNNSDEDLTEEDIEAENNN
jgi:hypothetical protein